VQVDPGLTAVDPTLAFRDFQLLKLKYDKAAFKRFFHLQFSSLHGGAVHAATAATERAMVGSTVQVEPRLNPG